MPEQTHPDRELAPDEATLEAPNPLSSAGESRSARAANGHPPVVLVEGSGPQLSGETQSLLQRRLRVAATALFLGFAVYLVWHGYLQFFTAFEGAHLGLYFFHIAVTAVLGLSGFSLCRGRCLFSKARLHVEEAIIFGAPAVFFLAIQSHYLQLCLHGQRELFNPAPQWILLIFVYAMFIPNSWRRAGAVTGCMAAAPVLMTAAFAMHSCEQTSAANVQMLIGLAITMGVTASVATVGVHTINTLRREAFEARQLGQYKLKRLLGSGGMGDVYLAEHRMMKRPCALKVIRPEKAGDPRNIARFEREVRTTARLSHWNSIDIFDYGRTRDGTFYYVMEYLPGMNLRELVERHGPMPPERVIYLLRQTCDALREAHDIGLVHRDIKPANIFAARRGGRYDVAKLLDFGLAKPLVASEAPELTQEGTITGSPLYMSPEQATGDSEPDARSDIYSLGAVAYFLLTGRPPFLFDKPIKVLISLAGEAPRPPSELRPDLPDDLERVVMQCLAKRPEDRFPTAVALAAALDECRAANAWDAGKAAQWWEATGCAAADVELASA